MHTDKQALTYKQEVESVTESKNSPMSLLNTQQQLRHAPRQLKISLSLTNIHKHTHTHTKHTHSLSHSDTVMYHSPALQGWPNNACTVVVYARVHTHTPQQYSGQAWWKERAWINVNKNEEGLWWKSDKMSGRRDEDWKVIKRTDRAAQKHKEVVCVSTYMCINTSGAGSAERV